MHAGTGLRSQAYFFVDGVSYIQRRVRLWLTYSIKSVVEKEVINLESNMEALTLGHASKA